MKKRTIKTIVTLLTTALIMSMPICASAKEKNNLKAKITDETFQNEENPDMYLNYEWDADGNRNVILFTMKDGKGKATNVIKDTIKFDDNLFEYRGKYTRVMDYDEAGSELSVEWLDKSAKAYEGIYKNSNVDTAFATSDEEIDITYTTSNKELRNFLRNKDNIGKYVSYYSTYIIDNSFADGVLYTDVTSVSYCDNIISGDSVQIVARYDGYSSNVFTMSDARIYVR